MKKRKKKKKGLTEQVRVIPVMSLNLNNNDSFKSYLQLIFIFNASLNWVIVQWLVNRAFNQNQYSSILNPMFNFEVSVAKLNQILFLIQKLVLEFVKSYNSACLLNMTVIPCPLPMPHKQWTVLIAWKESKRHIRDSIWFQ